jgi:hypothetical protein
MSKITEFLEEKYAGAVKHENQQMTEYLERLWEQFKPYADKHFIEEFTSGEEAKFQQRYWEMLMYDHLIRCGYKERITSCNRGPDFKVDIDGKTVWIECVAPGTDKVLDEYWKRIRESGRGPGNFNGLALRWTGSCDSKLKKIQGYIENGIINSGTDAVIIAINAGNTGLTGHHGEGEYPMIVDVVYGDGQLKTHGTGQPVERNLFLTEEGKIISAVIGCNIKPEQAYFLEKDDLAIVYNRDANVPLEHRKLGAQREYYMGYDDKIQVFEDKEAA